MVNQLETITKPIRYIPGVGERYSELLENLLGNSRVIDLLFHLPCNIIYRKLQHNLYDLQHNENAVLKLTILKHIPSFNRRSPYKILCEHPQGNVTLTFFHGNNNYLKTTFPVGENRIIGGKCQILRNGITFTHPDYIARENEYQEITSHELVYPLTAGISNKYLNKIIKKSLSLIPEFNEWLDAEFCKQHDFKRWHEVIKHIHTGSNLADLCLTSSYLKRLAYDELLAMQLTIQLTRLNNQAQPGSITQGDASFIANFISSLPFPLTSCQEKAIKEIKQDQTSKNQMRRLLQGDVGSGKTIIAIIAILNTVTAGKQAALMAPTAILAEQHYEILLKLTQGLDGINIALVTGGSSAKKKKLLEKINDGSINIIIGTHALFYDKVSFNNLGLAVIDEQHRFGVMQRLKLLEKGENCDLLLMSATPIPRTLALTLYGDMHISFLHEKPKNRKDIITRIISNERIDEIITAMHQALTRQEKIYWICPLIEESEINPMAAVNERFKEFQKIFGKDDVAVIHGAMDTRQKEKTLKKFANSEVRILIATTVIEVGIDIGDATIMIIEQAENFGLAALHQLRGRVGRGSKESKCILLYDKLRTSSTSLARLKIMRETNDGFKIAEEDLKIRGSGEVIGVKQSGIAKFKFASLTEHYDLLKIAVKDAALILEKDPRLETKRGKNLRILLNLFDYDKKLGANIIS